MIKKITSALILYAAASSGAFAESIITDSTITVYRTILTPMGVVPSSENIIPMTDDNSFGAPSERYVRNLTERTRRLLPQHGWTYRMVDFSPFVDLPLKDGTFSIDREFRINGTEIIHQNHDLHEDFEVIPYKHASYYKVTGWADIRETGDNVVKLNYGEFVDYTFAFNVLTKSRFALGCRMGGLIGDREVYDAKFGPKLQYKKEIRLRNNQRHHINFDVICFDGALVDQNGKVKKEGGKLIDADSLYRLSEGNGIADLNAREQWTGMLNYRNLSTEPPKFRYGLIDNVKKKVLPFADVKDENKSRLPSPKIEKPELDVFWAEGRTEYLGWKTVPFDNVGVELVSPKRQDLNINHFRNAREYVAKGIFYPKVEGIYEFILITESNLCSQVRGEDANELSGHTFSQTIKTTPASDYDEQANKKLSSSSLYMNERESAKIDGAGDGLMPFTQLRPQEGRGCISYTHPAALVAFRDGDAPARLPYDFSDRSYRFQHSTMIFEELDVEYGAEITMAGRSILYDGNPQASPIFDGYAADLEEIYQPAFRKGWADYAARNGFVWNLGVINQKQNEADHRTADTFSGNRRWGFEVIDTIGGYTDREIANASDKMSYNVGTENGDIDYVNMVPATTRISDTFNDKVRISQKVSFYVRPPNEMKFRPLVAEDFIKR